MIVRVRVAKHGFAPQGEDWRTNVCIVDLLIASHPESFAPVQLVAIQGEEYRLLPNRRYAWTVQEWDGNRP